MSYNILKKNVRFSGDTAGTIEGMVDISGSQEIVGDKTFTQTITSSADVMLSGSGKVSASFYYGDGSNLSGLPSGVGGSNTQVQFNDNGDHGGSPDFTFATGSSTLSVNTGSVEVLSASNYVSASTYYGDASNLTNIAADSVLAQNIVGQLSASQISHSSGLTDIGGNLVVQRATSGGIAESSGLKLDISDLQDQLAWPGNSNTIAVDVGGVSKQMALSVLESDLSINASNINNGTIDNTYLPSIINQSIISASIGISGAFFQGDGSGLTGVTGTPTPAGSNMQIQFNADGALGAIAGFTYSTSSYELSVKGDVSASVNGLFGGYVSASSYAIDGGTVIDANADITCGNITMQDGVGTLNFGNNQISGSGNISGSQFYGDGSTLSNLPVATYSNYTENRILAAGAASDEIKGLSAITFSNPTLSVVGNVSASINISASAFYGDGSNLTGIGGPTTTEFHVSTQTILAQSGKKFVPLSPGNAGSSMTSKANITNIFHSTKNFVQWVAPASGSIKHITVYLTDPSTIYSIPLLTGGNTTVSKDDIIFTLYKNNNDTTLTTNTVGEITASAANLSFSSSVGRKFFIPCDTGLFSGSREFDPGDVLKMGGFLPNADSGTAADAQIVITYELSGSDV